jgi:hypothetical protein
MPGQPKFGGIGHDSLDRVEVESLSQQSCPFGM